MGLGRAVISMLVREAAQRPFSGRIATLGRQHVYVTPDELIAMADLWKARLAPTPIELHREPDLARHGYLSDDTLFRRLGFSEVIRIDVSRYENCDELLDLNSPETPPHLHRAFDLVLDGGTMEHVFDAAAVLRHCCRMVKPQGRVIHLNPSSNCVDHGFYCISPTLYADFYSRSGFTPADIFLCRTTRDLPRGPWDAFDYLRAPQKFIPLGNLDDQVWFSLAVLVAGDNPAPTVPQQSFYESTWQAAAGGAGACPKSPENSKAQRLLDSVRFSRSLTAASKFLIDRWRQAVNDRRVRRHVLPYPFVGRF